MSKGSRFLNITGILMIVGGVLGIVLAILSGVTGAASSALDPETGRLLLSAGVLSIAGGGLELAAGILGVANSKKAGRGAACILFGFLVLALNLCGQILSYRGYSDSLLSASALATSVLSLLIPVLYLVGAFLHKTAR